MVLITNAAGARCSCAVVHGRVAVCSGVQNLKTTIKECWSRRSDVSFPLHLAEAGERSLLSDVASLPTTADGVSGPCMRDAVG